LFHDERLLAHVGTPSFRLVDANLNVMHYDRVTLNMSRPGGAVTLSDRRNELSRRLILDTAIAVLEGGGVSQLTMRAVAKEANISERTVFRYFATRDEFLDAIVVELRSRLELPEPPRTMEELSEAPRRLYEALESKEKLVIAGLHSELAGRIREVTAQTRWAAVRKLVDVHAPSRAARERKLAAANICYYLGASSWHFYRFTFRLTLEETIACAEKAIALAIQSLAE
jgi:AcrR family transcriptional regulator